MSEREWTPEQIETLRELWKQYQDIKCTFYGKIGELEDVGRAKLGISIEFFFTDGGCVGIGSEDREYPLLQDDVLEEAL